MNICTNNEEQVKKLCGHHRISSSPQVDIAFLTKEADSITSEELSEHESERLNSQPPEMTISKLQIWLEANSNSLRFK